MCTQSACAAHTAMHCAPIIRPHARSRLHSAHGGGGTGATAAIIRGGAWGKCRAGSELLRSNAGTRHLGRGAVAGPGRAGCAARVQPTDVPGAGQLGRGSGGAGWIGMLLAASGFRQRSPLAAARSLPAARRRDPLCLPRGRARRVAHPRPAFFPPPPASTSSSLRPHASMPTA